MSDPAARAALLLAAALGLMGAPPRAGAPPVCPAPRLAEPADARLPAVACAGAGGPDRAAADAEAGAPLGRALPLLFGGRIDLNRAPPRALEALPAIGPARAAAIASARVQRPFCSVEEVQRVRGIGPAIAAGMAPLARATCAAE